MVLSKDLKIAICFGLIMGAIFSLCNLCFASETVYTSYVDGLSWSNLSGTDAVGEFVNGSYRIVYFPIEPGYRYTITGDGNDYQTFSGFSTEIPANGVDYFEGNRIKFNQTYTFNGSSYGYVFFNWTYQTYNFTVTREPLEGMTNFIDNITYSLSVGNLSSIWVLVVPILAISVLFGLGFYLLKRLLNRIKRAKGGA